MTQKLLAGTISTNGGALHHSTRPFLSSINMINNNIGKNHPPFFWGAPSRHRSPKRKGKINDRQPPRPVRTPPARWAPLLAPPGTWQSKPLAAPRRDGPSKWHSSSSSVALLAPGRAGNRIGSVAWVEKCTLIYTTWKKHICQIWLSWRGQPWELQFIDIEGHDSDLANPVSASPSRILEIRKLEHKCQKWRSLYIWW